MFSKEESKKLRQEFWISFGKSFPRKWTLYNTKVKDLSFKFHFDLKKAAVSIDLEQNSFDDRSLYYEKFLSLRGILIKEFPEIIYNENKLLSNGKLISSIYVELSGVSIHNKNSWQETMLFLKDSMTKMEIFWENYQDFITS